MATTIIFGVLVLQILMVLIYWIFVSRRHTKMANVYPLYEVRDKLVWLVASGQLKEGDFLFQEFYKAANIIIPASHMLNLKTLLKAIQEARDKDRDPATEKKVKRIKQEISLVNNPEVKDVIYSFYDSIIGIIIKSSSILSLVSKFLKWNQKITPPTITTFQKSAWKTFSDYNNAACVLREAI